MPNVLTEPEQADAAWLEPILGQAIAAVEQVDYFETGPSRLTRLRVRQHDAAPLDLLLKLPRQQAGEDDYNRRLLEIARNEARLYQSAAFRNAQSPFPYCYDAAVDSETGRAHMLLKDYSATHSGRDFLTPEQAQAIVATLAQLQARWWDHPDLGRVATDAVTEFHSSYAGAERARKERLKLQMTIDGIARPIPPQWLHYLEHAIEKGPDLLGARVAQDNLTLCHNDFHPGNVLLPTRAQKGSIYLVDWATGYQWFGSQDFAWLVATGFKPDLSRELEFDLLRHYHDCLQAEGVSGYSWETCRRDYQLATLENLFRPLGRDRWDLLEAAVLAFAAANGPALLDAAP